MKMVLLNMRSQYKSWFCKIIRCEDYTPHQLNEIYEFYSNKNGYVVMHEWDK